MMKAANSMSCALPQNLIARFRPGEIEDLYGYPPSLVTPALTFVLIFILSFSLSDYDV